MQLCRSRPGLPRSGYGRAEQRRRPRFQLGFHGQWYQWHELGFPRDVARSQQRVLPRLRFSVALPLGINGGVRAVGNRLELPHIAELCADGRPGGTATLGAQAACCGPPEGRRPARAALRAAEARPKLRPTAQPQSAKFGLSPIPPRAASPLGDRAGDPKGSQEHSPKV